ncbi:MAG: GGDEF domain-containing protein [Sphingomicrobium sp.]
MAILRIVIVVRLRARIEELGLDLNTGRAAERIYAAMYLTFAATIGLFGALGLLLCSVEYHMVVAALIVGYGAGVAASISLRPRIGVPAIALGVTPAILCALGLADAAHLLLAAVLTALLLGGIHSMLARYRDTVEMIEMRQLLGSLARRDPLTGLANRFVLTEALAKAAADGATDGIVLHYIDLDRFKPVNDDYGHLIGDHLLQAVAGRLQQLVRSGDIAVRLGGDEFAVLQTQSAHPNDADVLARRMVSATAEPFSIDGRDISIGASIGSASGRVHGADLAALLAAADIELYKVKKSRHASHAQVGEGADQSTIGRSSPSSRAQSTAMA